MNTVLQCLEHGEVFLLVCSTEIKFSIGSVENHLEKKLHEFARE